MDKERIFDGRKIVKRKVQDALSLTFFQMLLQSPFQEFPLKLESLALHWLTDINLPNVAARQIFPLAITLPYVRTSPSDPMIIPTMNAGYIYSSFFPSCPHFPTWYTPFSLPHSTHLLARTELSPLSFSNESQALEKRRSPPKNPTTAPPEALMAVLTRKVRPCCCLQQWSLSWWKSKIVFISRIPLCERTSLVWL